jgi:rubredoxin
MKEIVEKKEEEPELKNRGRIIKVPLANITLDFSCPKCDMEKTFILFAGEPIGLSFGRCPRCNSKMQAKNANLDTFRVVSLLKEKMPGLLGH